MAAFLLLGSAALLTPTAPVCPVLRRAHRFPPVILAENEQQEHGEAEPEDKKEGIDLSATREDFEAGVDFGKSLRSRFVSPVIDDPGLPYADALVVISGTLTLSILILSGILPVGRPGWLTPLPGMEGWRGVPYILPALAHGSGMALCWLLGALAARAFESEAYSAGLGEAISRTWRAGAFAIGTLLFSTQLSVFISMTSAGLDPYLGSSYEGDVRLAGIADEVILDCLVQAVSLTGFRIFRWWDARGSRR
ncbi:hypothetical protein AB1Y20_004530 [Prymnesium parvum]|uniref:Uncharacterized protein n=1 Tax=Prymnesium parvum TaxID=97485 RepID=A0AB34IYN8_PRYPA